MIQVEADSVLQHSQMLAMNAIRDYVDDLKALLDVAVTAKCKTIYGLL
jgi:hypothetical protein